MQDYLSAFTYNHNYPLQFSSVLFFVFFSAVYLIYAVVMKQLKVRNILLLVFSLFFYYKVSGIAVIILLIISSADYLIGRGIHAAKKQAGKKMLLLLSILINLGCLFYFKYTNFFLELWDKMNGGNDPLVYDILLPAGISFFVFKSLSYIFDLYQGRIREPEKKYFNYVLYVSFFPNILAGPISRASDLLPQINSKTNISESNLGQGLFLIMTGAFKKIFIADFLAGTFVDLAFGSNDYSTVFGGFGGLMMGYGYTIQLYFDFSAYTDIVIGIACLLGFSIKPNFNKPFLAVNVTDFWKRWHLTLSEWLRDFLFTPLSFSMRRLKMMGAVIAVLITFIVCGFWHGASFTFIIWGAAHAVAMAWDVVTDPLRTKIKRKVNPAIYRYLSIFITFNFICLSSILFRADTIDAAWSIYANIFTNMDFSIASTWATHYFNPLLIILLALILHYTPMRWNYLLLNKFTRLHWSLKVLVVFVVFLLVYQVFSAQIQPFEYLEY